MRICPLASGSNGNATFVDDGNHKILIDAGVSAKQIQLRLQNINESLLNIKAIFLTHEHTDHTKGIPIITKKFNIPVFTTKGTHNASGNLGKDVRYIEANQTTKMGGMKIHAIPISHDGLEPVAFTITSNNKTAGIITDLGFVSSSVKEQFDKFDALLLETNYDENMLEKSRYPFYLKKRIASKKGHLSNTQAACAILEDASPNLNTIFLSHLSFNNNTQQLAYNTFTNIINHREDLGHTNIELTDRFGCSKIKRI